MRTVAGDLRSAIRSLRNSSGFTAAVVVTLALGIGVNTAMFSVVDRLLFRMPPRLRDPSTAHRLYFQMTDRETQLYISAPYARFVDIQQTSRAFSSMAMITERDLAVGTGDAAAELPIGIVSASFFGFFDAPPALGRYFTAREDSPPDGAAVAVLGYGFWQTRYGGRSDILGSTLQIGPTLYTVIGVGPRGFAGLWDERPPAAYVPVTTYASAMAHTADPYLGTHRWYTEYGWTFAGLIARRRAGVSRGQANADLTQAFIRSYEKQRSANPLLSPPALAHPRAIAASILTQRGPEASSVAKVATWSAGVALVVLLIACANVANLLLARALRRRKEIALRIALGASRGRLVSQMLTESLVLAAFGGGAGLLVATWGGAALRALFLPKEAEVPVVSDVRTLGFVITVVLAVGVLAGVAPAFQSRRADLTQDLKAGVREGTRQRSGTRTALLLFQTALSVVLLVGAGLFVRSLARVSSLRLGYEPAPVLDVELNMRGVTLDSARAAALRGALLEAARGAPGVEHASLQVSVPLWSSWSEELFVAGIDSTARLGEFMLNAVSPDYFTTLGTRIVRGRGITAEDREHAPRVMIVSQSMARVLWPGRDPIGRCVRVGADTVPCTYVVGVAEDIASRSLVDDPAYFYYLSAAQWYPDRQGLFARVRGDIGVQAESLRRRLQRLMPGAAYVTVTPLADIVGDHERSWRLGTTLFLAFGSLALLLAAIGTYSVIAYDVAQRMHELGVRVALGALPRDVVSLVVRDGLRVTIGGALAGGALAFWAARWLEPLLFRQSARDPMVFAAAGGILLLAAIAASLVPASRAARADPLTALRAE